MKFKEFVYTLKVCNIRWFAWFLPLPLIVILMQGFGSQAKFNDKYVNAVRLGNSGLWFIYSQQIQDGLKRKCDENRRLEEGYRREKLREEYTKEFGNFKDGEGD